MFGKISIRRAVAGPLTIACLATAPVARAAAPAAAAALIPTADFAVRPLVSGPQLSPDAKWVLALIGKAGDPSLGLFATGTGELRTFALPKGYELVSYRWAGPRKVLISVGKTAPWGAAEIYVTRLLAFDVESRKADFIGREYQGPEGDDILYVDPAGAWLLLSIQKTIYNYPSVYRVDLLTGAMREVVRPREDVWEWYADARGVVRAGIGFSNKKWSLVYRRADGEAFRKAGSARYDDEKSSLGLLRFALDSDEGYILSNEKTGRDALYRFNFATLELGELVFESPTNDVKDFHLSPDGKGVRAAYYIDDRDRVAWFDPVMKSVQSALDAAVPGREAWIVSRSADDSLMVVLVTSASHPGTYYYFSPAAGRMRLMAATNAKLKGKPLSPSRPVTYEARDGLAIQAYLTLPQGREAKNLPLIVMPHGGPFGVRDKGDYDPEVQFLANRGYAVLQPNFRGSESYGRDFEEKANGQWGRAMQDDLDDGMDWLVKQGIADPKRVCISGASYGGYAALWGATRNPERYRCAISLAGVTDLNWQLRYSRDFFRNAKSARAWRDRVQGETTVNLREYSPLTQVARLKVPVLLAHGKDDQRVPVKQSELYAKALQEAGKPHEYVAYEGEGHGLNDPTNLKDYLDRVERFLMRYNPAD